MLDALADFSSSLRIEGDDLLIKLNKTDSKFGRPDNRERTRAVVAEVELY